ncbi:MAG: S-layer homology domain-containing protein [Bacillota bacterium]|nr:S-layer homology domain-containing protein [Bacillota bacterium]
MTKKTRLFTLILILAFTLPASSVYANQGCNSEQQGNGSIFTDLDKGNWAYNAIMWMNQQKIMTGYTDHTFKPGNPITRGEFAKIMVLSLKLNLNTPSAETFRDVGKSNWAFPYVETAKYYLTGFRKSDGDYFLPNSEAVREDMAVALVKACRLSTENVDVSILDSYNDSSNISPNLKKYVATAIENGIMVGSGANGTKQFNPQSTLTRAESAVLLYNVINGNKVTFDGDKVTYDQEMPDQEMTVNTIPQLTASNENGKLVLRWKRIDDEDFQGYKVVISKNDSTPQYPDNGYLYWITDRNTTSAVIDNSSGYNGGDFGGFLVPGQYYYFSITAVYGSAKVPGNVLKIQYMGEGQEVSDYTAPYVTSSIENGKLVLKWQAITDNRFQGYKVVISKNDSSPEYPDNGYLFYITDRYKTSAVIDNSTGYNGGDFGEYLVPGQHYYFSVTALYSDTRIPGNVLYIEYPD